MFGLFRKKEVQISNRKALISNLTNIYDLLKDNGFLVQAEAIKKPLNYLQQDDISKFLITLKTVDIWGGSGAVWEVGGFSNKDQEREFQRNFIQLVCLLKETGIKIKTANRIAKVFKNELKTKE